MSMLVKVHLVNKLPDSLFTSSNGLSSSTKASHAITTHDSGSVPLGEECPGMLWDHRGLKMGVQGLRAPQNTDSLLQVSPG